MDAPMILYFGGRRPWGVDGLEPIAVLRTAFPDFAVEHHTDPPGKSLPVPSPACIVSAIAFGDGGDGVWRAREGTGRDVPFVHLAGSPAERVPAELPARDATDCLHPGEGRTDRDDFVEAVSSVLDGRVPLAAMPEGALVVDGGAVTRSNDGATELLSTDRATLVGRDLADLAADGVLGAELVEALREGSDQGTQSEARTVEFDADRDRTLEAWVGDRTAGGERLVTLRDVTDRKRQERRLREVERRYRRVVDQDLFGVYIIQSGDIRFVNRRAARMFGYTPEEMVGEMTAYDVVAEEDHDRLRENIRKREEGDLTDLRYELTGVRKDGSRLEFEVHSGVIEYEGRPALLGALIDITERKRRRQRIKVLNRVLRHNLRNDLNLVIGRMEDAIARLRDRGDEHGADVLAEGVREARGLVSTSEKVRKIQAALEHDRAETPAIEAVGVVERVVEFVREKYPAATVDTDLPDSARIQADVAFELVVENLVTNAVEHNSEDAEVTVALAERDEGWYRLRVTDDGPGIPEQERVVVDGDAEVTPLYHSSGVGLWTVAWIVESFGGSAEIDTDGVDGTVVTVDLRRAD